MITWHGFPKIIRAIRILGLGGLLRSETGSSEIVIQHSGSDLIAYDRLDGGHPDVEFAALVMRRPINRPGADLRLENRRHRLSFMPQATLDPAEPLRVQKSEGSTPMEAVQISSSRSSVRKHFS